MSDPNVPVSPAPTPLPEPTPAPAPQTGQPEQAQFVPFVVDGQTYQLDARLAERLAREPSTPPAYPQPQQPAYMQPQVAQEPELHELLFRDPKMAIQRIKDDMRQEIFTAYRQEQATQNFWSNLYRTDESMRRVPRGFIDSVVMENQRALAGLPDEVGIARVAQLVKERIAGITGIGQNTQNPQPSTLADGGSSVTPPGEPVDTPDPSEPQTLSALIRQKRLTRRQGMSPQS